MAPTEAKAWETRKGRQAHEDITPAPFPCVQEKPENKNGKMQPPRGGAQANSGSCVYTDPQRSDAEESAQARHSGLTFSVPGEKAQPRENKEEEEEEEMKREREGEGE